MLFCLGISKPLSMRTGLALPYMLGIDVISFSISMSLLLLLLLFLFPHLTKKKKKKKKIGEKMQNFIFFLLIDFQILHVFLLDISVHFALIKYTCI